VLISGLIIGSFLNVCISRLPEERSVIFPPSHCPKCRVKLKVLDLVPVFSYLMLGGRCRKCKLPISPRYPIVEALTSVTFLLLFIKFGPSFGSVLLAVFFSLLIVTSFIDIEHMLIYDLLVIMGIATGLIYSAYAGDLTGSILGICFAFIFFMGLGYGAKFFFKKESLGEGDVQLAIMLASLTGIEKILIAFVIASISGAVIGIALILMGILKRDDYIPFAPFLALGTLVSILL
jgi:leader peptidase (prepilin peptidase)/N-methyltransferase